MLDAPAIRSRKERRLDTVKGKHLFGRGLILGQEMGVRATAGVANSEQVHVGRNVHLFGVVARKGFREVENQICATLGKRSQTLRRAVEHLIKGLMAEL